MKKTFATVCAFIILLVLPGCKSDTEASMVVATTKPVYDFTAYLCQGTDIHVSQLVTENVSCLHDYTLQVRQMRAIEAAQLVVISGAGLEEFLHDILYSKENIINASEGIDTLCGEHEHDHEEHHHDTDPHIWLSTQNARQMAQNICIGLTKNYPQYRETFEQNLISVQKEFDLLEAYGNAQLTNLSSRNMITFHDGFSYFAKQWDLTIVKALEEESGSEASSKELIEIINLVRQYQIPAIFTEENGSTSAANIIASETDIPIYALSMGMSGSDYFEVMYHNIDAVKEALG